MERRAPKPAIEPLSQRTWQRIETRVFAELEQLGKQPAPSVGRPALALGVAGLALAASLFVLLQNLAGLPAPNQEQSASPAPAAALAPASSQTAAQSTAAQSTAAQSTAAQSTVPPQLELTPAAPPLTPHFVTTSAPAEARLGDSRVRIAEQSDVRIEGSDAEGWRVLLEQGEVSCEVAPRGSRPPFVVSAGDVDVRVVGTRFAVTRRASGTRVQVEAGHVQVEHAGASALIGPGQSWPTSAERSARPRLAARARGAAPSPLSRPSERPDPQREFERAAQLESSDPVRALATYQRLSRGRGAWSANALYARARLLLDGGHSDAARTLLNRYVKKYPAGTNAADARRLLESVAPPDRAAQ